MRPERQPERPKPWLAVGLIAAGLVVIVAALFALKVGPFGASTPALTGGVIDPPLPAANFTLHDQFDQPISLSSFRGKVVVLTFLYTNCPDACPLITQKLHQSYAMLGPDVSKLAILAVTVDPARDTVPQVRAYSVEKDMLQKWHFLVGPMSAVQPVWAAYGASSARDDLAADQAKATAVATGAPVPTPLPDGGYLVDHSAIVYLIDPAGNERTILDVDFSPTDLVDDVRALLHG
ncbi:MAG: SCO family protein, partial [Candidatus Dormibacteraceae bacterium]